MPRTKTVRGQHGQPTGVPRPAVLQSKTGDHQRDSLAPSGPRPGYALHRRKPAAGPGGPHIVLPLLLSTLIGTAVVLVGPFEHHGSAVFSVDTGHEEPHTAGLYRMHLLECAADLFASSRHSAAFTSVVSADAAVGTLRLDLRTDDPARGRAALIELTDRFMDRLRAVAEAARAGRTEGEQILEDRLTRLELTLSRAVRRARDARSGAAGSDPTLERDAARQELARRRLAFHDLHDRLTAATWELADLRAAPLPERPPIDPADRQREMLGDVEFQQDRAELRVQLAAVRAELLEVWQDASPRLDDLIAAAGTLEQLGQNPQGSTATGDHRLTLERAAEAAADYRRRVGDFVRSWTKEFVTLQQNEPDPAVARALDAQQRATDLLGDFLFEASTTLTTARDQVQSLNELSDDQARHHVLVADLTRAFHTLQAAHHQFEFAACQVRAGANFRLAAAVKSARGLLRRTQYRLQELDRRLAERARQQARQARDNRIAELEQHCTQLRALQQTGIEAIFDVQDRIDRATSQAEDHVSATATAQAAARRADEIRTEIDQTRNALTELRARRKVPVRPEAVHLISRHVDSSPSNLNRRLAYGWAAAVTAFLALILIQRLGSTRRP